MPATLTLGELRKLLDDDSFDDSMKVFVSFEPEEEGEGTSFTQLQLGVTDVFGVLDWRDLPEKLEYVEIVAVQ